MILRNRTAQLILFSVILVLLISQFKPKSLNALYKVEYDRFWAYKVHSGRHFDMIIIGDSRTYRGISPQAINKVFHGLRICNFGFSSGILDNEIFDEAEKRISPEAPQKIILIGITPGNLTDQENKHFHDIVRMTRAEIIDQIYTSYYLAKYLLPVKPSDLFGIDTTDHDMKVVERFHDNGWVSSVADTYDHSLYVKSYHEFWSVNKVSRKHIDGLINRIGEWVNKGYYVFTFRVPSSMVIDSIENTLSGFDEKTLSEQVTKAGGTWINIDNKYERYQSYDGIHLDEPSASLLSTDIALIMKSIIPGLNN